MTTKFPKTIYLSIYHFCNSFPDNGQNKEASVTEVFDTHGVAEHKRLY